MNVEDLFYGFMYFMIIVILLGFIVMLGSLVYIIISDAGEYVYLGTIVDFEAGGGYYFILELDNEEKVTWRTRFGAANDLRIGQRVYSRNGVNWIWIDGEYK